MAVFQTPRRVKRRLRDRFDPSRDLGHLDRAGADDHGE
jgi:predicted Rdx family selenoprotein